MSWQTVQKGKRIAKRILRKCTTYFDWYDNWRKRGYGDKVIGILRKTRVFCSNPQCCGNPRRLGEITRKEKIAELKLKEGLEEFYEGEN